MDAPPAGDDPSPVDSLSGAGSPPGEKGYSRGRARPKSKANSSQRVIFAWKAGRSLPVLELAYETYGSLSPARDNAILVVHGYTSSHHAAGRNAAGKQGRGVAEGAAGWFDGLIGPGKAVDTNR